MLSVADIWLGRKCLNVSCLLTGKYTIMGQVIDGQDTLDKMEKIPVGGLKSIALSSFPCSSYTSDEYH